MVLRAAKYTPYEPGRCFSSAIWGPSQADVTERSLIDRQLLGVLCLERRLALDMANLVDAQVKVVGNLEGQSMGIPAVQNRPLLSCQFLDHALKLGTGGVQEKGKGVGLYVCGVGSGTVYRIVLLSGDSPDASITVRFIDHPTF